MNIFPEEVLGDMATPRKLPSNNNRKFGTQLSDNTPGRPSISTAKKVVRVRKPTPPQPLSNANRDRRSAPHTSRHLADTSTAASGIEYSVIFEPGPIGLQLEPLKEDPKYGCRVVRFVDGGPNNPGQARRSGRINPGDLVMAVKAGGATALTYDAVIQLLKKTHATRELIFKSVWDSEFLDTQSSLKTRFQKSDGSNAVDSQPAKVSASNERKVQSTSRGNSTQSSPSLSPLHYTLPQAQSGISNIPAEAKKEHKSKPEKTSNVAIPRPMAKSPPRYQNTDFTSLVKSPTDLILLSRTAYNESNTKKERVIKKDTSNSQGPIIISLDRPRSSPPPTIQRSYSWNSPNHDENQSKQRSYSIGGNLSPSMSSKELQATLANSPDIKESSTPESKIVKKLNMTPPKNSHDGHTPNSLATEADEKSHLLPYHHERGRSPPNHEDRDDTRSVKKSLLSYGALTQQASSPPIGVATSKTYYRHSPSGTQRDQTLLTPSKVRATTPMTKSPFTPSRVRQLYSPEKQGRLFSKVFAAMYTNVGAPVASSSYHIGSAVAKRVVPAVASSSYHIGATVATRVVPAVASSSYRIGSAVTNKIGESIVGNSSTDFAIANEMKQRLLQELSQAKIALETQDTETAVLQRLLEEVRGERETLKKALDEKISSAQTELDNTKQAERSHRDSLEQKIQDLQRQKQNLEEETGRLQDEIRDLKNSFERQSLEKDGHSQQVKSLSLKVQMLEVDVEDKAKETKELEERKLILEDKCIELNEWQQKLTSQNREFADKLARMEDDYATSQESINDMHMELAMSKTMAKEMEDRLIQLETSKSNLIKHMQSSQRAASQTTDRLTKALHEKQELLASVEKELKDTQSSLLSLEEELEQSRHDQEMKQDVIEELKSAKESLESQLIEVVNKGLDDRQQLQDSLDDAQEELEMIRNINEKLCNDNRELETQTESTTENMQDLVSNVKALTGERDRLQDSLETTKLELERTETGKVEVEAERSVLKELTEKQQLQIDAIKVELEDAKCAVSKLEREQNSLVEAHNEIQSHMPTIEAERDELKGLTEGQQSQIEVVKVELDDAKATVARLEEEKKELMKAHDEIRAQLLTAEGRNATEMNQKQKLIVEAIEDELEEAKTIVAKLESEKGDLLAALQDLKSQIPMIETERQELKELTASQKSQVDIIILELENAKDIVAKLEIEKTELVQAQEEIEARIRLSEDACDKKDEELLATRRQLMEARTQLVQIESEKHAQEESLTNAREAAINSLDKASNEIATERKLRIELESKLAETTDSFSKKCKDLQDEADKQKGDSHRSLQAAQQQIEKLEEENTTATDNLHRLEAKTAELQQLYADVKSNADKATTQASQELVEATDEIKSLLEEKYGLNNKVEHLQINEAKQKNIIRDAEDRLDRMSQEILLLKESNQQHQTSVGCKDQMQLQAERKIGVQQDEIERLQKELSDTANQNSSLQAQLDEATKDLHESRTKWTAMENAQDRALSDLFKILANYDSSPTSLITTGPETKVGLMEIEVLAGKLTPALDNILSKAVTERDTARKESHDLRDTIATIESSKEKLDKDLATSMKMVAGSRRDVHRLQTELGDAKYEVKNLVNKVAAMNDAHLNVRVQAVAAFKTFIAERDILSGSIEDLTAVNAGLQEKLTSMKGNLDEHRTHQQARIDDLEEILENQLEILETKTQLFQSEKTTHMLKISALQEAVSHLETEKEQLTDERHELISRAEQDDQAKKHLQNEVSARDDEIGANIVHLISRDAEIVQLQNQVARQREGHERLFELLCRDQKAGKQSILEVQDELRDVAEKLSNTKNARDHISLCFEALKVKHAALKTEKLKTEQAKSKLEKSLSHTETDIAQMREQLSDKCDEMTMLRADTVRVQYEFSLQQGLWKKEIEGLQEDLQRYEKTLQEKLSEIEDIEKNHHVLQTALQKQLEDALSENEHLMLARESIIQARDQTDETVSLLNSTVQNMKHEKLVLSKQLVDSQSEVAEVKRKLDESKHKNLARSEQLKDSQADVIRLESLLAETKQENFTLSAQLDERRIEVAEVKAKLDESKHDTLALSEQLANRQAEVAEAMLKLDEMTHTNIALSAQLSTSQIDVAEFTTKLGESEHEILALSDQVVDRQSEVAEVESKLVEMEHEKLALSSHLDEYRVLVEEIQKNWDVSKHEIQDLSEQLANSQAKVVEAMSKLDESKQHNDLLSEQLANSQAEVVEAMSKLDQSKHENLALSEQLANRQAEVAEVTKKLDESEHEILALSEQVADRQSEVAEVESKLVDMEHGKLALSSEIAARQNESAETKQKLHETEIETEGLRSQCNELTVQVEKYKAEIAEAMSRIMSDQNEFEEKQSAFRSTLAVNEHQKGELVEQVELLQVQLETARERLISSEQLHRNKIDSLIFKEADLTSQVKRYEAEIGKMESRMSALQASFGEEEIALETALARAEEENTCLRGQIHDLKSNNADMHDRFKMHETMYKEQIERLMTERNEIAKQEEKCRHELVEVTSKLATCKEKFSELQTASESSLAESEKVRVELASQVAFLNSQLLDGREQLKTTNNIHDIKIKELDGKCIDLTESLAMRQAELIERDLELEKAKTDLVEQVKSNKLLQQQLGELKEVHESEIGDLVAAQSKSMSEIANDRDTKECNLRDAMSQICSLKLDLTTREAELENETKLLIKQKADNEIVRRNLRTAEDELSELRCELLLLNEELNESDETEDSVLSDYETQDGPSREEVITAYEEKMAQHSKQRGMLEDRIASLSDEMAKVLHTNKKLEATVNMLRDKKLKHELDLQKFDETLGDEKAKTERLQQDLNKRLEENSKLANHIEALAVELQETSSAHERDREMDEADRQRLNRTISSLFAEVIASRSKGTEQAKCTELARSRNKTDAARIASLELQMKEILQESESTTGLMQRAEDEISKLKDTLHQRADAIVEHENAIDLLQDEKQNMINDLREKTKEAESLTATLEKERMQIVRLEEIREELVFELADASRILASQKGKIKILESSLSEANRGSAARSTHVDSLLQSVQSAGIKHLNQIQEMQNKIQELRDERENLIAANEQNQENESQFNRKISHLEKVCASLQERYDDQKKLCKETKAALRILQTKHDESEGIRRELEKDASNKKLELEHCTSKIDVLESTVSRLKSDCVLLSESEVRNDSDVNIVALRTQIYELNSAVSTMSVSLQREKQEVSKLNQCRDFLLGFTKDTLNDFTLSQESLMMKTLMIQNLNQKLSTSYVLPCLDLAGTAELDSRDVRHCLQGIMTMISKHFVDIENKKERFVQWKEQEYARCVKEPSTAPPIAPATPLHRSTASCMKACNSMKVVLNDKILTPIKESNNEHLYHDSPTKDKLREAVSTLEEQLSVLTEDLDRANFTVQQKDQLFSEMEHLVSHQEKERVALEKRIYSLDAEVTDLEHRLRAEHSYRVETERKMNESVGNRRPVSVISVSSLKSSSMSVAKVAAARLMLNALERKENVQKAIAFRKWTCVTSASMAASEQEHVALALSKQLEITREKLIILKTRLKDGRRSSVDQSKKPRLRRLLEKLGESKKNGKGGNEA